MGAGYAFRIARPFGLRCPALRNDIARIRHAACRTLTSGRSQGHKSCGAAVPGITRNQQFAEVALAHPQCGHSLLLGIGEAISDPVFIYEEEQFLPQRISRMPPRESKPGRRT